MGIRLFRGLASLLLILAPLASARAAIKIYERGQVNTAYSRTFIAAGGTAPYTWSISAGALPPGLKLGSTTGTISGTFTQSGGYQITLRVQDSSATPVIATYGVSYAVFPAATTTSALSVTTTSLATATVGSSYQQTLTASGGTAPYAWALNTGSLPAGLALSSTGTISGTPTTAGTSNFSIKVTDAAGASKAANESIVVSSLTITNTSLPNGLAGSAYQASVTATGGTAPYTWSMSSGSLPPGLSLASSGAISGTPTTAGSYTFTVKVTDAAATTKTATFTVVISGVLTISTTSLPNATVGVAYQQTLTATGGTAPYTWSLASGTLPAGLSLASNGTISGTPATAASYTFSVKVTDAAAGAKTATYTVSVGTAQAQQYTMGTTLYPYSTQAKPAKGASFTDATFHLPVTRVTNAGADIQSGASLGANYSTWNPLSSDGNYLLFSGTQGTSGFHLYDAHSFAHLQTVPVLGWWNGQDPEPRWDRSGLHPTWIYYRKNAQLRYYDVADSSDHLVHDFASYLSSMGYGASYYILNGQEGSSSSDGRYWAFMAQNGSSPYNVPWVFTYDKATDTVVAGHSTGGHSPNNVMMSPSGNYVYVAYSWTGGGGEYDGPHVYTRTFTNPIHVFTDIPHANFGWTIQGHEVIIGAGDDVSKGADYLGYVRLDTGQAYTLYYIGDLGWDGGGVNVAYTDKQGWVVMSEYGGPQTHWADQNIWAFELDESKTYDTATKPRVWRIAFTQCFGNTYEEQANATMDASGTRIWWGSNWRSDGAPMDVYQVTLPANWWNDLKALP